MVKIAEIKNGITNQTKFTMGEYEDKYFIRKGDLLFSWSGQPETSIDAFWWYGPDAWLNQHIFKVEPHPDCYTPFFYYLLRYLRPNFVAIARNKQTTGLGHVTKTDLERLQVGLPSFPEQRAIAHILGTLDDKIELNRRMNDTLNDMSRAVFKSWFIDFDPVRAKAGGRDPGVPGPIADLFPDSFEESKLGAIPAGWEVCTVGTLAEVTSGKRPAERHLEPTDNAKVPLWGGNGPMAYVPAPLFDQPILLTGRVGTLGSVFRIRTACWPSDNTLVLLPKQPAVYEYLLFRLQRVDFDALNRGSTQPLLTQTDLKAQPFVCPPSMLLREFHQIADSFFAKADVAADESRTLAALRETLLPKLFSGDVHLTNPEHFHTE